ncbi:MAG: hypothetical protein AB9891_04490 [Anaerolineaceae bacterium]
MNLVPGLQSADSRLRGRRRLERIWSVLFKSATFISVLFLGLLLYNIINQSFGLVAVDTIIDPATLSIDGKALEDMNHAELTSVLQTGLSKGKLRQVEREKQLAERSRDELYDMVWAEVGETQSGHHLVAG